MFAEPALLVTSTEWLGFAGVALSSAGIGGVLVKYLNRPVDQATVDKLAAEARAAAQTTTSVEVQTIRNVLDEVRTREGERVQEMATLWADINLLKSKVNLLEERERHMLTRAAVHEAWDQMAFAALISQNPAHPPPPPLAIDQQPSESEPS